MTTSTPHTRAARTLLAFKPALKPVALASLLLCQGWAMAQTVPAPSAPTETVEVIGTSPLPGQGVSREALPYTTHVIKRKALEEGKPTTSATTWPGASLACWSMTFRAAHSKVI
ncbi:hypothetical protein [Ideonella paludis]|uniref:hypothetical protein n=1 Tax=Ideonella paludis TaxID=1233411 RepID=UPI003639B1B2